MRVWTIAASLILTACESEPTPAEQARLDEAAVAEVEANQIPPADMVMPEPISQQDIERRDMSGLGCSFVAKAGGVDPMAVTMSRTAYMKIDGEIEQFAADAGSAESVMGTRTKYDGGHHSLRLLVQNRDGVKTSSDTVEYDARLVLRDGRDRVVYDTTGKAKCGD